MRRVYFDNAATSFPKPPQVVAAVRRCMTQLGASPGRGAYAEAREAAALMLQCRRSIAQLIGAGTDRPEQVVFTLNTSDALNLAIRGVLLAPSSRRSKTSGDGTSGGSGGSGGHVVTTHFDHNSVLRPLNALTERDPDITQTRVPCDPTTGLVDPDDIRRAIRPQTRLIALVHGSNVTGTLQPIDAVGRIAREHGILFCVDAAQTLGHVPIDVGRTPIDLLAAPGHKGLLGPLGTGVLWIRPGVESRMVTIREGGTGSVSERDVQPDFMPDRFEPGSHNAPGIAGLAEGVRWILDRGIDELWQQERQLMRVMLDALEDCDGVTLYGPRGMDDRCGVFSVRVNGYDDPLALSAALEQQFGLLTRSGIHCAPLAHRTLGTDTRGGTTRFSFGPFLTDDDVRLAGDALRRLSGAASRVAPV